MSKAFMKVRINGAMVVEVEGKELSEKLINYFEYLREECLDQTGLEPSFQDVIEVMKSEEFEMLFN